MPTTNPKAETEATNRAKTLTPADAKRLAAAAPSLLKVPAKKTFASTSKRARHYAKDGRPFCGFAGEAQYASTWAKTNCATCLALRVQEKKHANNESAQRYHERKKAEKLAELVGPEGVARVEAATAGIEEDTRHVEVKREREVESLDEAHVRPAQLVAAIEVMIASAHERRRRDEEAKRPVDRFVWGQLEALRAVRELVSLAARKERR